MNRLAVVGSSVGGGVAHSTASRIPWQKRNQSSFSYKQKGGNFFANPFGIKQTVKKLQGKPKNNYTVSKRSKKQKGAGWFDSVSQGMFGIKQTRGRRKPKPAVIHSAARKQKGGLLGLGRLERWQKGRSKRQQNADAAWMRKNL
jgi:hypothetical protein